MSQTGISKLLKLAKTTPVASINDVLSHATPDFGFLQSFFSTWLSLDVTTLAAVLTVFGTISGALHYLKGFGLKAYWWMIRLFTASISIGSKDMLNREVINWISAHVLERQGTRILTARTKSIQNDYFTRQLEETKFKHENAIPIQYLPTFGTTWFIHARRLFMVRRFPAPSSSTSAKGSTDTPDEYASAPIGHEPLVVMCMGRSIAPIKRFLDTCREFAKNQRETFTTIRTNSEGRWSLWDQTILKSIRPLDTVHFDEELKAWLVADIKNYLRPETRQFYLDRGVPYRRGYLLHGTPGTGKSSLSLALAGIFGLDLYLCHLPSVYDDATLQKWFFELPPRCIVLLEDIDAIGLDRRPGMHEDDEDEDEKPEQPSWRQGYCTLSGLLNVLDGVSSQEGRIVLMTSNQAHKLDPALVRPGRIDSKIYLGHISAHSVELMFLRMYNSEKVDDELRKLAREFGGRVPENKFTPAQLQEYLLTHRDKPAVAAREVETWAKDEEARVAEAKNMVERAKKKAEEKKKTKALVINLEVLTQAVADGGVKGADLVKLAKQAANKGGPEKKRKDAIEVLTKSVVNGEIKGEKLVEMAKEIWDAVEKEKEKKSKAKEGKPEIKEDEAEIKKDEAEIKEDKVTPSEVEKSYETKDTATSPTKEAVETTPNVPNGIITKTETTQSPTTTHT